MSSVIKKYNYEVTFEVEVTYIDQDPIQISNLPFKRSHHDIHIFREDPAELGVQPKGPGITYADPKLSRVKTSKDPVAPPPRWLTTISLNLAIFLISQIPT